MNKVKLFKIDSSKNWEDLGGGSIKLTPTHLVVENSEKEKLMEAEIKATFYTRQCGTLLQSIGLDHYILSFESPNELNLIWDQLSSIQNSDLKTLPIPSENSIEFILDALNSSDFEYLINSQNTEEFVLSLCSSFLSANSNLDLFFQVFRILINSCSEKIIKELLNEKNFPALLKTLEMDPELSGQRNFLAEVQSCTFNNVLDIRDDQFIQVIHFNFRLQVFKDKLVTKTFDERVGIILNSFSLYINEEIIKMFTSSGEIRAGLVIELKKLTVNGIKFLEELLRLAKSVIDPSFKFTFYDTLHEDEILFFFAKYWKNSTFSNEDRAKSKQIIITAVYDMFGIMP